jgi:hypothetical protein
MFLDGWRRERLPTHRHSHHDAGTTSGQTLTPRSEPRHACRPRPRNPRPARRGCTRSSPTASAWSPARTAHGWVRESAQSWRELLVDIKQRGLEITPDLAVGDGALGFWKALEEVFPGTRHQRCWPPPESQQALALLWQILAGGRDSQISFSVTHGWSAFWRCRPWR